MWFHLTVYMWFTVYITAISSLNRLLKLRVAPMNTHDKKQSCF